MLVLTGICLYAVFSHLTIALRQQFNRTHFLFACVTLAVALAVFAVQHTYLTQNLADYISAQRWSLTFILLAFTAFHWFFAEFTEVRPRPFLIGMSLLFCVLFVMNLFQPYSIQYSEIYRLEFLHLPWGELVTKAVGQNSRVFIVGVLAVLIDFGFAIYALSLAWRRTRRRTNLTMLLALGVFLLTGLEGIAVRAGLIDFIHLGLFGFLTMILMMGVVLSHDTQQRLRDSERRFRSLVEQSPFSIQVLSPDGRTEQVNPAWEQLWGAKLDTTRSYNILHDEQLITKGVMPYIVQGFSGTATEIPPIMYDPAVNPGVSNPRRDRWVRAYIYPIKDEANAIRDVILMHEDVTDRKRVEDAIRLIAAGVSSAIDEQFFQQLVLNLAKVFEADYAFIALQDKHDWSRLNMLAICAKGEITSDLNFSLACVPFMRILSEGTCVYPHGVQRLFPEECLLTDSGVQALIGTPLETVNDQRGLLVVMHSEPIEYIEQAREILDIFAVRAGSELHRQQAEAHIRHLAYQDYLTGMANRAQLHERLSATMQRARQTQREGALLLIDLDHFKTINDALGHDVGDEVLRAVGNRLRESCDQDVFLARLGGDEFVALLEMTAQQNLNQFRQAVFTQAQRILTQLANPVYAGERAFTIGASIGIVRFPEDGHTDLDILRHADMALYQAKSKGRGIIQLYLPDLEIAATNRLRIEAGLRTAIEKNELELYYQPLVNAHTESIGAEVLLRWHHPELGDIPPSEFIPVAEDAGLIHSIGGWIFDQACLSLKQWSHDDVPFTGHLSINVCPWQFARPDFVSELRETVQRHQVDPHQLMLELTETALLYDISDTIEKLKALRVMGFSIALDDFGTGYSSLAYLRDLPLDQLKIDKNFVSELSTTVEHPLVGSMIAIGKHMKLAVIAEGVETEIQRDKLIALGCEHFQGFLFCRPIPAADFLVWLDRHKTRN